MESLGVITGIYCGSGVVAACGSSTIFAVASLLCSDDDYKASFLLVDPAGLCQPPSA